MSCLGSYWLSLHGQKTLFHSSKNHLLCSQKKESHTGLARHEVEWMMTRVFVFRVNYTFKGVCACACVCVCALQFILAFNLGLCGKSGCDWMRVWKCMCDCVYLEGKWTLVSKPTHFDPVQRSETVFFELPQTWHMYTHRRSHSFHIYTPAVFPQQRCTTTGPVTPYTHTTHTHTRPYGILHLAKHCGKHADQRFAGALQLLDSSEFMTQHVYSKKTQLCVTPFICARAFYQWHIQYK